MINKIKASPFFADELKEAAAKVRAKVSPAFTVNKLMGMMQMDPTISIVLDYVVTRDIPEVVRGVHLPADDNNTLISEEGRKWWAEFRRLLVETMNMTIQQSQAFMRENQEGGAGGAAGGAADGGSEPPPAGPGLNEGQV
jgi:hypothetical protein